MKNLLPAVLCLLIVVGCSKERDTGIGNLAGKWELRLVKGGYSYQYTTYEAGNGNIISFTADNRYNTISIYDGDTSRTSGGYSLLKGVTCTGDSTLFLQMDGAGYTTLLSFAGDTLFIRANGCIIADGVDRGYIKINAQSGSR